MEKILKILIVIIAIAAIAGMGCKPTKVADDTRNYAYEAYCDSIYEADPDFYLDVLCETNEYCSYVEEHGEWWYD